MKLHGLAQTVNSLASILPVVFLLLALVLLAAGALFVMAALLLGSVGYNWLASLGWGLKIELYEGRRKE